MKEYIIFGTKNNAPHWDESIITTTTNNEHKRNAMEWARANGFINVRVLEFENGDKPDFIGTLNI